MQVVEIGQDVVCHRSDLHDELTRLAIGDGERGTSVQILLSSKVVACDPKDGTVTLDNGEIIHADVVIGADGIHVCMFLDRPMGS